MYVCVFMYIYTNLYMHFIDVYLYKFVYAYVYSSTWWQRCIECLKLHVSFRKRAIDNMTLFRKMTYNDKASYGSSLPCIACIHVEDTRVNNTH